MRRARYTPATLHDPTVIFVMIRLLPHCYPANTDLACPAIAATKLGPRT